MRQVGILYLSDESGETIVAVFPITLGREIH